MSTTNIPQKTQDQICNYEVGDLGNTFIAGLVIWGTPPFAKPQNPLYTAPPQNALSQSRVNGAWESSNALRLGGTVEALL